jgi:fumarate hydratase class II
MMESIHLLSRGATVFVDNLLEALVVNEKQCAATIEQSLMMCTSLAPVIGYDNAAKLAKEGFETGKTIRQLAREKKLCDDATLDRVLDPLSMTQPGGSGGAGG